MNISRFYYRNISDNSSRIIIESNNEDMIVIELYQILVFLMESSPIL